MRKTSLIASLAALAAVLGCETGRQGLGVDLGAAVRAYERGLESGPGQAEVERLLMGLSAEQLNDLGVLYERKGRLERAAWAYQLSIWRNPRLATPYVNLGNVLRKQRRTEEALFRYRQAMNADRGSFAAANNFADLCAEQGIHLDEAIGRLKARLSAAGTQLAYGLDTLGWLHHLKGDHVQSVEMLQAASAEAAEGDPELRRLIHQHLAIAREALSRRPEAPAQEAEARSPGDQSAESGKQ